MTATPVIIYHNNCADGFAAAWVAKNYFKPVECDLIPVNYGEDYYRLPDRIRGNLVYVLDFSFKRDLMEQFRAIANAFTVLDHHKTAKEDCEGLPYCTFDLSKSGAMLTWELFYPGKPAPSIIDYVQDRDLWLWKLPHSQEINAVIQSNEYDFNVYSVLNDRITSDSENVIKEGETILRIEAILIKSAIKYPVMMWIGGHCVPVINNPTINLISKMVEALGENQPFAATFFLRQDGKWQFSLRSRPPKGVDVSAIAKSYGGGGHPGAAGFTLDFEKLADLFKKP